MGRRSRKSKRKLNSLLLALLLSAILLIVSTYAWFSANKTVEITGITAKVSAAEGLQISLDAKTWGTSVEVNETTLNAAKTVTATNLANMQPDMCLPTELHPVSTTGAATSDGITFYSGQVSSDGTTLTSAAQATATNNYIVFDIYLKNSSSQAKDTLQLNGNSSVALGKTTGKLGVENTGLENCPRVAIELFDNTAPLTAQQTTVTALTAGTSPAVSIWEPNYNRHILEVVTNDGRIATDSSEFSTLGLKSSGTNGTLTGINGTEATDFMAATTTIQTGATVGNATNMIKAIGTGNLELTGNAITKARVYIWLEGQDPDCIDTASTGVSFNTTIKFCKPAVTGSGS